MRPTIVALLTCLGWAAVCPPHASAEDREVFVAVGYGGVRLVSEDGCRWEKTGEWDEKGGDDSNNLMSGLFAEGKFVVVGGGGGGKTGGGHILVSEDGRQWREVLSPRSRVNPILFGNGRFVAGGPRRTLLWSDDGIQWQEGGNLEVREATHFRKGAFGDGRFVFVGNHGGGSGPYWSAVSPDGITVTGVRTDLPGISEVVFFDGHFIMVTRDGDLLLSSDGLAWKQQPFPSDVAPRWIHQIDDRLLAGGRGKVYQSTNGLDWEPTDQQASAKVLWTDGHRFIGTQWAGKMWFSQGGQDWSQSDPVTKNGVNQAIRGVVPD